jgi:glycogen synthase
MRILHVFDHSIPLQSGYTFRSRSILLEQERRGWSTRHLTSPKHIKAGPNPEVVDGLTFHRTPAPTGLGSDWPVVSLWRQMQATEAALDALVRRERPDILHAHSPVLTAIPTGKVAHRHGLPWVYEIRAFWEDAAASHGTAQQGDLRYRATRWLETRSVFQADAVGCICEGLKVDLLARGLAPEKLFTIPNAVDMSHFGTSTQRDAVLARLGYADADVIGFIGSFYDYEGLDDLLAALPELARMRPNIRLLLVGGGPMADALKAQAAALNLEGLVHFAGRVPHSDVNRYYSLIDVLVYPRKRMRLTDLVTPLKPLEAMAEEKLVAASDVGGHKELIEPGVTGELFRADDPADLARVVANLFERRAQWPERRAAAKRFVQTERNWEKSVANYAPVYARLAPGVA